MRPPLNRLSATHLAQMLAAREVTSEAVTHSYLDAVREREPDLRAFAWFDGSRALEAAQELDRAAHRGALHGLPVAVKDVIDTADIPTGYGSAVYVGHVPRADAACVSALKAAGGFVFGKTVTAELANFTPGATRNPHHLEHTPGGSSSGSAAAVAAKMVPLAIGTQTAGSVIRPASFCGVVGFVPTRGCIPRAGAKALSDTLDVVGVFANSVEDAALLGSELALAREWRQAADSPAAPSIGWTATPWSSQLATSMRTALEQVARIAAAGGARVRELAWPRNATAGAPSFGALMDAQRTVQLFETARHLAPEYEYRRDRLSARLVALIEEGSGIRAEDYLQALTIGRACAAAFNTLADAVDVVLTPSAPGEALHGLGSTGDPQFNRPWHLLGVPQINVPIPRAIARGEAGLPLGLQLIGPPGSDARVLAAAHWLQARLASV